MGWQDDVGLTTLANDLQARPRPRPASVLFAPSAQADDQLPFALPPMPGYQNPGAGILPDFSPIGPSARGLTPGYAAAPPSWDRVRDIFGANINGRNVAAPAIFNGSREQHPLASFDEYAPTPPSLARQLYENSRSPIPNEARMDLQNAILARHNLTRDLEMHQQNMGQGLFTNAQRESIGQWGSNPNQGGGTQARLAGAAETNAGANQTQAMTGAATLEQAMSSAMQRQRFMERFPSKTPAEIEQLLASEEARGGFAPRTLQFPIGGGRPASGPGGSAAPAGQGVATSSGQSAGNNLLSPIAATPPTLAATIDRLVPRPTAVANGQRANPDISVGELVSRIAREPGLFADTEAGRANRTALRPYLESRFQRANVDSAAEGTRSLGGMSWSPSAQRTAQMGNVGSLATIGSNFPIGQTYIGGMNRLAGGVLGAPLGAPSASTALARVAPAATGVLGTAGRWMGKANPWLLAIEAMMSSRMAYQAARSGLGGGMTPEQEGNAILDAALNRNQW